MTPDQDLAIDRDRGSRVPHLRILRWVVPLLLLVTAFALHHSDRRRDSDLVSATEAKEQVAAYVEQLLSYDYKTMAAELQSEKKWLTPDFAAKYAKLVTNTISPVAVRAKATTRAVVKASGVVSSERDKVTVLLFVNIKTKGGPSQKSQTSGSRIEVMAVNADGSWHISELNPV